MNTVGIGMLGCGVVGGGVAEVLATRPASWLAGAGPALRLEQVLVRDPSRPRRHVEPHLLTTDPALVVENPAVSIVIEVMGGIEPASAYVTRALEAGKHVVTANKELIAREGDRLRGLAEARGVALLYEASVGGGIPLIAPMRESLAANRVTRIRAIINGTTNYILTKMARAGWDFAPALEEAQRLGYAEPDPTNDIEGYDAAFKLSILASMAFGQTIPPDEIECRGIGSLTARDFKYAEELGYSIKLLATGRRDTETFQARVVPAFVPQNQLLAKVDGVLNAVELECDLVGDLVFYGPGAGALPTASSVLADVLSIASGRVTTTPRPRNGSGLRRGRPEEIAVRYYIRLRVVDRPGVLAHLGRIFADNEISIASVIQKEVDETAGTAEIVIMTHLARQSSMEAALKAFEEQDGVARVGNAIPVEE